MTIPVKRHAGLSRSKRTGLTQARLFSLCNPRITPIAAHRVCGRVACVAYYAGILCHAIHCRADCPQPGARGAISRAAAACCIVPLQTGDMRRESNVAGGHGSCAPLCGMPGVAGMAGLTRSCAAWKLICLSQRRILQQFLARVDAQLVIYVLVVVLYSVLIYV